MSRGDVMCAVLAGGCPAGRRLAPAGPLRSVLGVVGSAHEPVVAALTLELFPPPPPPPPPPPDTKDEGAAAAAAVAAGEEAQSA